MSTTRILQFTGADLRVTKLGVSSNVEVGTANLVVNTQTGRVGVGTESPSQMLDINGNVQVGTANLFVDTQTGRVGVGVTEPGHTLDVVSEMNLREVSNTASIKYNSNVVTEFVRSKKFIKYPRVAMTQNDESSTTGYVASSSSQFYAYSPWKAFDENNPVGGNAGAGHGWASAGPSTETDTYDATTGAEASTTTHHSGSPQGEWIQIQMPDSIYLHDVAIHSRSETNYTNNMTGFPKNVYLYGSNDNSNWTLLKNFETVSKTLGDSHTEKIDYTAGVFKYFAFVINSIHVSGTDVGFVTVGQIQLFGIPEYDPEADGTDVIMQSVPNVPNTDWLEVYWDAGNTSSYSGSGSTTVTDLSGNGATGTITGTNGFDSTYNAWEFDGNGDYIRTSNAGNGTGEWAHSMAAWFKVINPGSGINSIMHLGTFSSYDESRIFTHNGKLRATIFSSTIEAEDTIPENIWVHGTLVYKGGYFTTSNALIYVNGSLMSTTQTQAAALPTLTGTTFTVGATSGNSEYFNGHISNARLFNRALSADEVWQLYAYQKEYFEHGNLGMTLKAGRLGIGTEEPRAVLDVRGASKFDQTIDVAGELVPSFTGQHVCFPDGDMEQGLVVSANKNKYVSLNGIATGSSAIRSDESLPVVSLSNVMNDSSVFGVVHELEKGGTSRLRTTGGINTKTPKIKGDDRAVVNSLGEGAMWVANTNGNLVSGDYITTSNVAGYGQRQDDDLLHNYTVAKITMDCDFNPQELPVQVIKSELDTYGRLQWEDDPSGATEPAYKIRYLDTDGQQTDEANCVHRAAYVGCTYHCG
jgi:hypothetical protein